MYGDGSVPQAKGRVKCNELDTQPSIRVPEASELAYQRYNGHVMTDLEPIAQPTLETYQDVAGMMNYLLLDPHFSDEQIEQGSNLAKRCGVGAITPRPADVERVTRWVAETPIEVTGVVGYPHGITTTAVKLFETRDLLQRGAKRIETPLNSGRMISRQFRHLETELLQMSQECRRAGAKLTLAIELAPLSADLRVIACRLARRSEVDCVRAIDATLEDLQFLSARLGDSVRLEAGANLAKWEDVAAIREAGCISFQTVNPLTILDGWKAELARRSQAGQAVGQAAADAPEGA